MSETALHLIDTHCHIDIDSFADGLSALLERARRRGVREFVLPGYIASGWQHMIDLADQYAFLHPAPGLHPLYMAHHPADALQQLDTIAATGKVTAIGEIGLDLLRSTANEHRQRLLFEQQLAIASCYKLPVLLHVRKAHDQVMSIIRQTGFSGGGIVHAFNGSMQQAEKYILAGFKLGYGGTLTYSRAKRIRKLAADLPLSAIVLETDAPDIPLFHRREEPNSPEFLPEILDALCTLRKESREEIARTTTANVLEVLPKIRKAGGAG